MVKAQKLQQQYDLLARTLQDYAKNANLALSQ